VLSLALNIFPLCGSVIAIVLGGIGLGQIKRTGEKGRGLAIAGITIASLVLAGFVGVVGANVAGYDFGGVRDPAGQVTDPGDVGVGDLRVGDCIESLPDRDLHSELRAVPCAEPHSAEVYALFDLPEGSYPGEAEITSAADAECNEQLQAYSPAAFEDDAVQISYLYPTEDSWRVLDDREVACIAVLDEEQTGSIRDM
jgi:hypothetical protein